MPATAPPADDPPKRLTAADFLWLPEGCRGLELVNGAVVRRPAEPFPHGFLRTRVVVAIGAAVERDPTACGTVGVHLPIPAGVGGGGESVRATGVAVFDRRPLDDAEDPDGYPPVPPRLSVQLANPAEPAAEAAARVADLLAAGTGTIAVLDPRRRTLTLFDDPAAADLGERELSADETFSCEAILPGFAATVGDFFERRAGGSRGERAGKGGRR